MAWRLLSQRCPSESPHLPQDGKLSQCAQDCATGGLESQAHWTGGHSTSWPGVFINLLHRWMSVDVASQGSESARVRAGKEWGSSVPQAWYPTAPTQQRERKLRLTENKPSGGAGLQGASFPWLCGLGWLPAPLWACVLTQ